MAGEITEQENRRFGYVLVAVGVLAAAAGIRLIGLTRESFWVDEVISFNLTGFPGLAVLPAIADQIHPPLYFLGLAQWRSIFGSTEFAVRSFSVAASVIAVLATMLFAREVGSNRRTALWAAVLAAVSPLSVFFAQEARMYAMTAALIAFSSWSLLIWLKRSRDGGSTLRWALIYVVCIAVLLLTHHVGIVVALAQGMAVFAVFLIRRNLRLLIGYLAAAAAVAVLFLPWLRYVQVMRSGLYRAGDLVWMPSPGMGDVFLMFTRDLVWGSPGWAEAAWYIAQAVAIFEIGAVLWILWSRYGSTGPGPGVQPMRLGLGFALWMVIGPVVVGLVVSWVYHPILWYPRFCTLILPPAVVLAACAIDAVRGRFVATALPAVLITAALFGLVTQHRALTKGGMRNFARYWNESDPPDVVAFFPKWKRMVARYEVGQAIVQNRGRRLERRVEQGVPFTLWVCSSSHYDSIWRPDWERREREWHLSLGPQRPLETVDRMDIVEVEVPGRR